MLFLIGVLLKLSVFFKAAPAIIKETDSFTYQAFAGFLEPIAVFFPVVYALFAFGLMLLQAYLLTVFINNNRLMAKANFLPGIAYILTTSLLPDFNRLSSPLIVSTLFLLIFIILFSAHNDKTTRGDIYNAGLILGLAGLLFPPALIFIVWIYIALATLRPFKLNEWVVVLIGVVTPYYFLAIFLYLADQLHQNYFFNGFTLALRYEKFTAWHAGMLFLILMPLLAGVYYMQAKSGRMLIHVRKAWNLFLSYAAICMVITFVNVGSGIENWVLFLLPAAAIHGYGYYAAELKLYPWIAFWLSVIFIVTSQIFSGLW